MSKPKTPRQVPFDLERIDAILAASPTPPSPMVLVGGTGAIASSRPDRALDQNPHVGEEITRFVRTVARRLPDSTITFLSFAADPVALPEMPRLIDLAHASGLRVDLHTHGLMPRAEVCAFVERLTIEVPSFEPATFSSITGRNERLLARVRMLLGEYGPSGIVKGTIMARPENTAEISSGTWFAALSSHGISRAAVRWPLGETAPQLPDDAEQVGEYAGLSVFKVGEVEVTLWDYAIANTTVPTLVFWPDGSIRDAHGWE